jgi:two-component system, NtrC family, sensor histidine kinase HydH
VRFEWRSFLRPDYLIWLVLFTALAVFSPGQSPLVITILILIGAVQVFEPRIGARLAIIIDLLLCYPLIFLSQPWPFGIRSSYWVMLLLPVISAAANFSLLGTAVVAVIACLEDLSFLAFIWQHNAMFATDPTEPQYVILPDEQLELALRMLSVLLVSYLTHQLAKAKREEAIKYQRAAAELADANRNLKEAEAQVRRSERLAALGQLTAGLAHELRNPMGTMKTSAEMLARSVEKENDVAREMAGFIREEVDRTNSLITRFLDFARPQSLRRETGDLPAMLDRAIERFEREKSGAAASITVYKNYDPAIPPLAFDSELMERVIANLLTNAAQASPAGAVVTVKTRLIEDNVEIAVIDRGSGIDAKNLESIFNPFFTTKPEGTGLGLAICSKIVDEHGGHIAVESSLGEGSVFRVFLPLATTQ